VVLKSKAVRTEKILDTHPRQEIDLRALVEKNSERLGGKNKFGRSSKQVTWAGYIHLFGTKENWPGCRRWDHTTLRSK